MKSRLILAAFVIIISSLCAYTYSIHHKKTGTLKTPMPSYDSYIFGKGPNEKIIDFGTQPNAIFTSESLFHDRILLKQLAEKGWTMREHRFRNGKDMIPYTDGRLDVMVIGDIPAYMAMTKSRIGIFSVIRQGFNTIVSRKRMTPIDMKGIRIGYPANTTAHFTLERALKAANLTINDITSVPMQPDEMENAMKKGSVDAIVSWEPTASTVLSMPGNAMIAQSEGFSYIAMDLDFTSRNPDIQKAVLAAVARAVEWARLSEENIRTNLDWDRKAAVLFFGKSPVLPDNRWVSLMKKETIDNPSFPMIPKNFCDVTSLHHDQFEFMKKNKLLPEYTEWKTICENVHLLPFPEVIKNKDQWMIDRFDYSDVKLYQDNASSMNGGRP